MKLKKVELRHVSMELLHHFETSSEVMTGREFLLLRLETTDGAQVWSEVVVSETPYYIYETVGTAWHILDEFMIPAVLDVELHGPGAVLDRLQQIRGHNLARASLEMGVWGLQAVEQGVPLATVVGGTKSEIAVGISIGIQETVNELLQQIESFLANGYQRIKLKIKPGWDIDVLRAVRRHFPQVPMMADANAAYTLADAEHLRQLDEFNLTMVEQPLGYDDIIDHSRLQRVLETPICLDESIHTPEDARKAIELGACGVINIKPGRVGGFLPSIAIHDLCAQHGLPVWCGGMLESGVGRAYNIALSALPNFALPGDTAASSRYWRQDIVEPPVEVTSRGTIAVPSAAGLGFAVVPERVEAITLRKKEYGGG